MDRDSRKITGMEPNHEYVDQAWLGDQINIDEFLAEYHLQGEPEWIEFKSHIGPGDEVREFSTPKGSFRKLEYKAGYAVVRDSKIIWSHVTIRNDHLRPKPQNSD